MGVGAKAEAARETEEKKEVRGAKGAGCPFAVLIYGVVAVQRTRLWLCANPQKAPSPPAPQHCPGSPPSPTFRPRRWLPFGKRGCLWCAPTMSSPLPPLNTAPAHSPPPLLQAPEVVAVRKTRLSLVRTHNELAKLELRDDHQPEAEVQFKAAIEKCKQIYGDLSPEAGEWRGGGGTRKGGV